MPGLLVLMAFGVAGGAVYVLGVVLAARLCGAAIYEVSLFTGPVWMRGRFAGLPVTIRRIPVGGAVRLEPEQTSDTPPSEYLRTPASELAPLAQLVIQLGGVAALAAMSAILLGTAQAGDAVMRGLGQVWSGAVSPIEVGTSLVNQFMERAGNDARGAFGTLFAKAACASLLPLPHLDGFKALSIILSAFAPLPVEALRWINNAGAFLLLAFLASWGLAVILAIVN